MSRANRHTKPSFLRYKAAQADVALRVQHARVSGNFANPYPEDDRRHARFTRALNITVALDTLDAVFDGPNSELDGLPKALRARTPSALGPVVAYDQLVH